MKRVQEIWGLECPEQACVSIYDLTNNAYPFQK